MEISDRFAHHGVVDDDPMVFALRDRASWPAGLVMAAAQRSPLRRE